jgi:hypothetical protein
MLDAPVLCVIFLHDLHFIGIEFWSYIVQIISSRAVDSQEDDTYAWQVRKVVYLLEARVMLGKCVRIAGSSKLNASIMKVLALLVISPKFVLRPFSQVPLRIC